MTEKQISIDTSKLGFDPNALREKYRLERDKRIRQDGLEQYVEIKGRFDHFAIDPYVEPGFTREPLTDEVEVALIGGGFGGLLAAAHMVENGVDSKDIRVIDKAGDVGGTWYWNRYPGAACDVESYVYLPLLEELNYIPREKYSHGPEILQHARNIARHYNLYDNACFQTDVTEIRWDESISRWIIHTNRNDQIKAKFIAMSNGYLQKPKLPGIPGLDTFKGHVFHTSRWDYDYTGGDATGNLENLKDKRVGIIGTGATAVQAVPHLGEAAEQLYVFQRTPSSVDVKTNAPTDMEWAKSLKPGWQKERMDNFHLLTVGGYQEKDLVADGWTDIMRKLSSVVSKDDHGDMSPDDIAQAMELADFSKMEEVRARVDSLVDDPKTAELLKPYYRQFCKRPAFHNEYLTTFNLPNVELVDTEGQGVEKITDKGIVVDGIEYEVDCIIFATGFEVGTEYGQRSGFEVVGRNGVTLTEKWAEGITTLHGMHIRNFPNCYMMSIYQAGLTANFPHMLNETAINIGYIVGRAIKEHINVLEVSEEAEADWVAEVIRASKTDSSFQESCTPSYYNNEGKPWTKALQNVMYTGEPGGFEKILADWREAGDMAGLEVR